MKQLPSTISTDDLLKQLENEKPFVEKNDKEPSKRRPKKESEILSFLNTFNIQPGDERIHGRIIYNLYKKYADDPLSEIKFYNRLINYIKIHQGYFFVNQKSLDLSERVIAFLTPTPRPKTKIVPLQIHFNNFIKKFDLKSGKAPHHIWVSLKTLYDLYDEWTYNIRKKKPLGYKHFSKFCQIYFPITKQTTGKIWISLDESITEFIKQRNVFKSEEK